MDTRQLKYFVSIVEEGSLSAAAVKLGVAQPSLSQHIKTLEDRLGSALLIRTSKGVTVTDAGQTLYEHAKSILSAIHLAKEEIRFASEEPYGKVSFGLPSSVSMVLSVPLAERVLKEMPKVHLREVEAMSGFIRNWLHDETVDMAILYDVESIRHMHTQKLMTEDLYFYAAPDAWPLRSKPGKTVSLSSLKNLPLVLPSSNHGLRALIDRSTKSNGTQLNVVLEMDSLAQIKSIVSKGNVATILAPASTYDYVDNEQLVGSRIIDPVIKRSVYLVRNPEHVSTRASREVEKLTLQVVEELVKAGKWVAKLDY